VLFNKAVDAARVRFHQGALRRLHQRDVPFRRPAKAEGAKLLVDIQGRRTEDLGELAASYSAQQIHLPQTVLGHDIALRFDHIFYGTRADMRNAPTISFDKHVLLQTGYADRALQLRKWPVHEPPHHRGNDDKDQGDKPGQEPQEESQSHSHRKGERQV